MSEWRKEVKTIRPFFGWLWELNEILVDHLARVLSALALVAAGVLGAWYVKDVRASRNSVGSYSLPAGQPVVSGTQISSSTFNSLTSDLATELSDSKSRSGKGDFTAPVRGANGSVSSPTWSFTNDTGTGYWLNAASDLRLSIGGTAKGFWSATGLGIGVAPAYPLDVASSNGVVARIGSTLPTFFTQVAGGASSLGFNMSGTAGGWTYGTTGYGLAFFNNNIGDLVFYTAPSGTGGTAATGTERVRFGLAGLTVGASGTPISASYRGTTTWNPGTIGNNSCATTTISLTGAAAGADCNFTPPDFGGAGGDFTTVHCWVTANTCNLRMCTVTSTTPGSATWACRVNNP